jgi:hypothetical protein
MDITFKLKFYKLWQDALNQGFSSCEAREYASLELTGKSFIEIK